MLTLELISATLKQPTWRECLDSWSANTLREWSTRLMENDLTGQGLLESYQSAYEESNADILAFVHDDLTVLDPLWYERVLQEFKDDSVGMIGFGGALRLGHHDIYRIPYDPMQLARYEFISNMTDAETHGTRFKGSCDVSTLDGMALFVRRSVLLDAGGWPLDTPLGYYLYDHWLACQVKRQGLRTRLLGVLCDHPGGKTLGKGRSQEEWIEAHRYFYDNFKDCLPMTVKSPI
jgi:GT2 family glycosyltransferase